jgi:hypothetical protein
MGADLNAWIEYDAYNDPPFGLADVDCECLALDHWTDLRSNKDYRFMAAICGCRNASGIPPLYERRGLPLNPGRAVRTYFEAQAPSFVGWLNAQEVHAALVHHGVTDDELSLEVKVLISVLDRLAGELSVERVRLVFMIESA